MPFIEPLSRDDLAELEGTLEAVEKRGGYIPNSVLTLGRRPEMLRALLQLQGAVQGPGKIDPGLKSLVTEIASKAAGCRYCQAHAVTAASKRGVDIEKIQAVWSFEDSPLFTDEERVALRLARDAASVPSAVTKGHYDELRKFYDDEQITELLGVICLMGFLNRWNDAVATELEDVPLGFASANLGPAGWDVGKHVSADRSEGSAS